MAKKSKVIVNAPRNIDLPPHVIAMDSGGGFVGKGLLGGPTTFGCNKGEDKLAHPRRKCLCLAAWLCGLLFLCTGVVVIAHFLLSTGEGGDHNDSLMTSRGAAGPGRFPAGSSGQMRQLDSNSRNVTTHCDPGQETALTLEQKVAASDLIVVAPSVEGSLGASGGLQLKIALEEPPLKGRLKSSGSLDLHVDASSGCLAHFRTLGDNRVVLFLAGFGNGRHFAPIFQAVSYTPKLTELIARLAKENLESKPDFNTLSDQESLSTGKAFI